MKFLTLLCFVCSLANSQSKHDDITYRILNKFVKENDTIDLEIKNSSLIKYYLPIINNKFSEKLSFPYESYFFLHTEVSSQYMEQLAWYTGDGMIDCNDLDKYWEIKKSNFLINDFILLESKSCIKIRVPFHSVVKVCDYLEWSIQGFKDIDKKNICIWSTTHEAKVMNVFLSPKLRESLELMGYKLYEKYIESNKVPILNE
jgi:hypothetical protein